MASGPFNLEDSKEALLLLKGTIKSADIGHPAKPRKVHLYWSGLIMEEFFAQGDEEAKLGLPVSPLGDRSKVVASSSQQGFIEVIVAPLC